MSKHRDIYAGFFNICEQDWWNCEVCQRAAMNEVHHIKYLSHGTHDELDVIENLIGLCKNCHNLCHDKKISVEFLQECHLWHMNNSCD